MNKSDARESQQNDVRWIVSDIEDAWAEFDGRPRQGFLQQAWQLVEKARVSDGAIGEVKKGGEELAYKRALIKAQLDCLSDEVIGLCDKIEAYRHVTTKQGLFRESQEKLVAVLSVFMTVVSSRNFQEIAYIIHERKQARGRGHRAGLF